MKKSHRNAIGLISLIIGALMMFAVVALPLFSIFSSAEYYIQPELMFTLAAIAMILFFIGVSMLFHDIIRKTDQSRDGWDSMRW